MYWNKHRTRRTRRAFIINGVKAGGLVALLPLGPIAQKAKANCSFAYGSGVYGGVCYPGTLPNLLNLPASQGDIQQNGFNFYLKGEPNRSYEIQHSPDLTNWTTIGTLTMPANGEPLAILDSQTTSAAQRFYRANPL